MGTGCCSLLLGTSGIIFHGQNWCFLKLSTFPYLTEHSSAPKETETESPLRRALEGGARPASPCPHFLPWGLGDGRGTGQLVEGRMGGLLHSNKENKQCSLEIGGGTQGL